MSVFIFIWHSSTHDFWVNMVWITLWSQILLGLPYLPIASQDVFSYVSHLFSFESWYSYFTLPGFLHISLKHFLILTTARWFSGVSHLFRWGRNLLVGSRCWTSWRATSRSCPCRAICRSWPTRSPRGTWEKAPARGKDAMELGRTGTVDVFFWAGFSLNPWKTGKWACSYG